MSRILILRPEPGASETARRAAERGLDAIASPLFEVVPLDWEVPDAAAFDGLLLTSANAIRHGGEGLKQLRNLRVHAVGKATGDAAREAGFDVGATGDAGVEQLLSSVALNLRLLHLCGAHRRAPEAPRQSITRIAVYESRQLDRPSLNRIEGSIALIHSTRAGRRFAELIGDRQSITLAAISEAAADAAGSGWKRIAVADMPNDDALLALAARLCNKPLPQ